MNLSTGARALDLIVLGAGPAGSSAAKVAADLGVRVALVDKKRFPRDKLCGGGLTGRAVGHHHRIFGDRVPDVPLERRDSISFHAFGEDLGTSRDAPPLHLVMRRDFDARLLERAIDAGALDMTGQPVTLDPDGPALHVGKARIEAPLVIAADGVNSSTAKMLFGQSFDRTKIGFALEVEHPAHDPDRPLRIDFGAADWGYGWQFPKACGTTVGVGGVMSRNADMKSQLARYLDTLGVDPSLPVKGQFLPFGDFREVPGKGRILLAGDAAGLVDPITGEGIAHALHSGELAARAAADALRRGTPDLALADYTDALRPVHAGLRHANRLRHLMFQPALRATFVRSFRNSRTLRDEYLRLLAGETEYGPLMRKMALRLPGFALRVLTRR